MGLIAIRSSDQAEIESFSVEPEQWFLMKKEKLGSYLMPETSWPAVLKTSIYGNQYFAYASGFTGSKPAPESIEHINAKTAIVKALRLNGYAAWVEKRGTSDIGELWGADVLCKVGDQTIAFEVQLSQQTMAEYESRTTRYLRSGIKVVWLVRAPNHFTAFCTAVLNRTSTITCTRPALETIAAVPFYASSYKQVEYQNSVMVFPKSDFKVIPVADFAVGFVKGKLKYINGEWIWD